MLFVLVTIGVTWGAGNAIGHRVVDAIIGPRTIKHETVVSEAAPASAAASPVANSMASASCDTQSKAFQEVSLKPLLLCCQCAFSLSSIADVLFVY